VRRRCCCCSPVTRPPVTQARLYAPLPHRSIAGTGNVVQSRRPTTARTTGRQAAARARLGPNVRDTSSAAVRAEAPAGRAAHAHTGRAGAHRNACPCWGRPPACSASLLPVRPASSGASSTFPVTASAGEGAHRLARRPLFERASHRTTRPRATATLLARARPKRFGSELSDRAVSPSEMAGVMA
jgi:hypothetical protein